MKRLPLVSTSSRFPISSLEESPNTWSNVSSYIKVVLFCVKLFLSWFLSSNTTATHIIYILLHNTVSFSGLGIHDVWTVLGKRSCWGKRWESSCFWSSSNTIRNACLRMMNELILEIYRYTWFRLDTCHIICMTCRVYIVWTRRSII